MVPSSAMRILAWKVVLAGALAAATVTPTSFFATERVAEAALARAATLRHLVTVADLVVEGTPMENTSVWEEIPGSGKRIVTYTRVEIAQSVYGKGSKDVWVRTLGGVVGNIGQRVDGEAVLVPGERAVLFLKALPEGPHAVVEMAQGHYLVKTADNAPRLHPSPRVGGLVAGEGKPAHLVLGQKIVPEAIDLIRAERKAVER